MKLLPERRHHRGSRYQLLVDADMETPKREKVRKNSASAILQNVRRSSLAAFNSFKAYDNLSDDSDSLTEFEKNALKGSVVVGPSVPFPGARNYRGRLSLQKFNGDCNNVTIATGMNNSSGIQSASDNIQTTPLDRSPRLSHENEMGPSAKTHSAMSVATKNGSIAYPGQPLGNCVEVVDVMKSYGIGKKKLEVLVGIDMTVPTGAIYGLLGPSGCGKTTLLRCIVGQLKVDSGSITVFGNTPGDRRNGIPGEKVGYMPQEIALYNEFTIRETMNYFGRIHDMPMSEIKARLKFLLEFLQLPKENRFIRNLSGGQKRRVSFAVALLQQPPLLILDEPTVGVDPLLRRSIWNHLVTIAKAGNTTVIITTHYIEEARQANVVGLLRGGRLLAEASPDILLRRYQCETLEDVFLKLCTQMDNSDITNRNALKDAEEPDRGRQVVEVSGSTTSVNNGTFHTSTEVLVNDPETTITPYNKSHKHGIAYKVISRNKSIAMIMKNFIRMWRNVGTMVFQFIIPSIQIILFCLAIGHTPVDLDIGVVNYDNDSLAYGNLYLNTLNPVTLHQIKYNDMQDAFDAVRNNDVWCVIYIPFNYTQNLLSRDEIMLGLSNLVCTNLIHLIYPFAKENKSFKKEFCETPIFKEFYGCTDVEDDVLEGSKIRVWLDVTSQQIAYTLREELVRALQNFSHERLESNGMNPDIAALPMEFEDPIYGSITEDPNFTEFMAPGIILSISYFMAVGLTALAFILERKEGLLDRTYVAGVNTVEIMLGHFVTQFFVMLVQIALSLLFMIVLFGVPCRGSPVWVILLTILQGTCGMAYGLLISAFCDEEHSAIMFALGSFYCNLLLSGIIWPINGMPYYLRYISYFMPQTIPTESMRALLARGWDITYKLVWQGFLITFAWLVFFLIITCIMMRRRR